MRCLVKIDYPTCTVCAAVRIRWGTMHKNHGKKIMQKKKYSKHNLPWICKAKHLRKNADFLKNIFCRNAKTMQKVLVELESFFLTFLSLYGKISTWNFGRYGDIMPQSRLQQRKFTDELPLKYIRCCLDGSVSAELASCREML